MINSSIMIYKITSNSQPLEYEEIQQLLHKVIENDFFVFFNNARRYNANCLNDYAEILYDICHDTPYYGLDKQFILLRSNINGYGTYAIENLLDPERNYYGE